MLSGGWGIAFAPEVCDEWFVLMVLGLTESDGFAVAMLGVILLGFGVLLMLGFCMFRNASRRDGDVDRLLDEVAEVEKAAMRGREAGKKSEREPWESDSDWWK